MTDDKRKQGNQKSNAPADKRAQGAVTATKPAHAGATGGSGHGRGLALLALVVALGAAGGAAYVWNQIKQQLAESRANSTTASSTLASVGTQAKQAADSVDALKSELATVKQELADQLAKQGEAVEQAAQGSQAGISKLDQTVTEQLSTATKTVAESLQTAESQMSSLRAEIRAAQKTLEDRMQAQIDSLQLTQRGLGQSLEVVRENVASGGDRNAWTLSEVDYLLQIASHRLRYQEDVDGALSAVVMAQQRLNVVDELAFAPVQVILEEEIAALRSAKQLDRAELAHTLDVLAKEAYSLPLRNDARTQVIKDQAAAKRAETQANVDTDQEGWWEDAATSAWGEIKQLVVIRHERREAAPLIAPQEEYFLAQNLRLKIEQAQLAALLDDGSSYQDNLATALQWIDQYFDTNDERVIDAVAQLKALQQVELHPYLPDVSRSLRTFRDIMETRKPLKTLPDENTDAAGEGSA